MKASGIGIGYIHEDYVSYDGGGTSQNWDAAGTGTCTGEGVHVRVTPGGEIIGKLYSGDRFEVDGTTSGEWVHVKVSGIGIGYIHEDYVAYDGGRPDPTWKAKGTALSKGNSVRVRKTPGGTILGVVNKGNRFEVDGTKSGQWIRVKVANIGVGYIHEDYVLLEAPWNAVGTATSTGDGVNVRMTPGGEVVGKVDKGNRFEVDGKVSGEWVHVNVAGIGQGYIHEDYVKYD